MVDPLNALLIGSTLVVGLSLIFWPKYGLITRWERSKQNDRRVLIEDALKHLYDCEYRNVNSTLNSVAGNLGISGDLAAKVIGRLQAMGLIESFEEELKLTAKGRSYALRMIRVHRLWERYLADETSVNEADWHTEAEKKEHKLTPDEVNILAAQMGNPVYDPHGDPIPTPSGLIPQRKGIPLTSLKPYEFAHIIHIEDEPQAIYAQLVAQGLHRGMQIRILEASPERIHYEAEGEESVLAPLFAANVTVLPVPKEEKILQNFKTLSELKTGEEAEVIGISKACRGQQRRRLMDFGVVPGSKIKSIMDSVGRDPTAFEIRGATVALRRQHTDKIYIKKENGSEVKV